MWTRQARYLPSLITFAVPAALLSLAFFLVPMGLVASYTTSDELGFVEGLLKVVSSSLVYKVFLNTLEISVTSAIVAVLLAYPVALHIWRRNSLWRTVCLTLVLVPFWTSILVKSYAFMVILGDRGLVNTALSVAFGIDGFRMLFNRFAVIVGMTNFLTPFAIFPILASLSAQNQTIQSAADVMGASQLRVFWSITFPQTLPGVLAALLICMVISMGFFITPALLGGRQDMMMSNVIDLYTREILDWQSASLIALLLLGFCGAVSAVLLKLQTRFQN